MGTMRTKLTPGLEYGKRGMSPGTAASEKTNTLHIVVPGVTVHSISTISASTNASPLLRMSSATIDRNAATSWRSKLSPARHHQLLLHDLAIHHQVRRIKPDRTIGQRPLTRLVLKDRDLSLNLRVVSRQKIIRQPQTTVLRNAPSADTQTDSAHKCQNLYPFTPSRTTPPNSQFLPFE